MQDFQIWCSPSAVWSSGEQPLSGLVANAALLCAATSLFARGGTYVKHCSQVNFQSAIDDEAVEGSVNIAEYGMRYGACIDAV